jgi:hypothetical protein
MSGNSSHMRFCETRRDQAITSSLGEPEVQNHTKGIPGPWDEQDCQVESFLLGEASQKGDHG